MKSLDILSIRSDYGEKFYGKQVLIDNLCESLSKCTNLRSLSLVKICDNCGDYYWDLEFYLKKIIDSNKFLSRLDISYNNLFAYDLAKLIDLCSEAIFLEEFHIINMEDGEGEFQDFPYLFNDQKELYEDFLYSLEMNPTICSIVSIDLDEYEKFYSISSEHHSEEEEKNSIEFTRDVVAALKRNEAIKFEILKIMKYIESAVTIDAEKIILDSNKVKKLQLGILYKKRNEDLCDEEILDIVKRRLDIKYPNANIYDNVEEIINESWIQRLRICTGRKLNYEESKSPIIKLDNNLKGAIGRYIDDDSETKSKKRLFPYNENNDNEPEKKHQRR